MDWRPLHKACWAGDAGEVARLLAAGADPNRLAPGNWRQRPLHRTLEFRITHPKHDGHVQVVRQLLDAGADPALRATVLDLTPWELAWFCGLAPAEVLLRPFQQRGAPHPDGLSPLWIAAASRLPESDALAAVRRLRGGDGDMNKVWRKATPLIMAAAHAGHYRVVDALLEAGADPNLGASVLHASCDWHLQHLVPALEYLAGAGWHVHQAGDDGQTALHKAAFLGYTQAIRSLLRLGADRTRRDARGRTPLDLARQWRKPGAVRLLADGP